MLYLFLLWVARSALKDLRSGARGGLRGSECGLRGRHRHVHGVCSARPRRRRRPKLRVKTGAGLSAGSAYDLSDGALLGRGDQADIRLEDGFASARHARLVPQGDVMVLEDLGSTNGTYLNGEPLRGPQPLHAGDRISIGDSEFSFER